MRRPHLKQEVWKVRLEIFKIVFQWRKSLPERSVMSQAKSSTMSMTRFQGNWSDSSQVKCSGSDITRNTCQIGRHRFENPIATPRRKIP